MNMDDIELKLLLGQPIPVEGLGNIYSPLVNEIAELGQGRYNEILSILLIDKNKLDIPKEEKIKITTLDLIRSFCVYEEGFAQRFSEALKFIFKEEAYLVHNATDMFFCFGEISEGRFITEENMETIQAIVRVSNQVKIQDEEEEEYRPANPEAAKIIAEMLERRKNKPKPKPTSNLHSIISGLANKSNTIGYFDIGKLSIYQLYDKFHRQEVVENYHYTLVGIYSGNVDSKKINYGKMHWTKIIEST